MLVDYTSLADNSKVWIYPSSKKLYPQEVEKINEQVTDFLKNWKQNDLPIPASFQLAHKRILIVITDAEMPLLTDAINELVSFILTLEQEYNTVLMDKMNPCFKQGIYVQYKDLKSFKKLIKDKAVNKNTIVFDNTIQTKMEFENYWEVPAKDSWYGNLF